MSKLRQILRLYCHDEKTLKISGLTGVSRSTLKKYIRIFHQLGLTINDSELLSDNQLDQLFGENLFQEPGYRYKAL